MPETETLLMAAEKMSRQKACWTDTPPEILSDIANRLETRSEFCRFRAVCKTWQGEAPLSRFDGKDNILSQILPFHFSPSFLAREFKHPPLYLADEHLVLVASSVCLVQSIENPDNPPFLFAVEEFIPGKLNLRTPLSRHNYTTLPENFPQTLDLSRFRVSEISRLYTLTAVPEHSDLNIRNRNSLTFDKVILFAGSNNNERENNTNPPEIKDYSLMMLYNDGYTYGTLARVRLSDGVMSPLHGHGFKKFDDVVNFRGRVCAVDRRGRTYWVDNGVLGKVLAMDKTPGEGFQGCWKKRLVESCGELYLVTRCPMYMNVVFEVYKLNEKRKKWDKLEGIGNDRILFATIDGCFFVPAMDLPTFSGNCIVVGRDVFPPYNAYNNELESHWTRPDIATAFEVVIFDFGSGEWRPIELEADPEYSNVLYPQPWLSSETNMFSGKGKEVLQDSVSEKCPESIGTKEASSSLENNPSAEDVKDLGASSKMHDDTTIVVDNTTIVVEPALVITDKPLESGVIGRTKFQGINVSSDLLPTLEEIWAKHGNVLEGNTIRGGYVLGWALESMANMAILVQNTSDGSMTEPQADYLCSNLHHLQLLGFKVMGLVPSIVKALNMYNKIANNIEARNHA
uniref:KIB1-4 beta-propeller domain-containing protein n=1 Tax=Chenopodium quinoa TaxID=63459 RepID=A0A803MFS9_CHEQI